MYSIVEFAHMIGMNTADFGIKEMSAYTKWWMKQPVREDIVGKQQSYKAAMQSRALEHYDPEQVSEDEEIRIVADMGLTQQDIDALEWGIRQLLEMFDFSELPEHESSLKKLGDELEPLVTTGE